MTDARSGGGRSALILSGARMIGGGLLKRAGALSWFGRLPGGLRFGNERTRVRIPRQLAAQYLARLRPRRVDAPAPLQLI